MITDLPPKRCHSGKHFSEFYLQDGGKNQVQYGDYYVTVTLRISALINYFTVQ